MGFSDATRAKRSLLTFLEEGKDFIIDNNVAKNELFDENRDDTDILYLSRIGFQMFLSTAQKPMAKYFARVVFEIHDEMAKILNHLRISDV